MTECLQAGQGTSRKISADDVNAWVLRTERKLQQDDSEITYYQDAQSFLRLLDSHASELKERGYLQTAFSITSESGRFQTMLQERIEKEREESNDLQPFVIWLRSLRDSLQNLTPLSTRSHP